MADLEKGKEITAAVGTKVGETVSVIQTQAQKVYDRWSTVPIFIGSILWIIAVVFQFSPVLRADYSAQGLALQGFVFVIFLGDIITRFVLEPNRRGFFKREWILVVALFIPPLRILFVLAAISRLHKSSTTLARQVGLVALYAVTTVVLLGALLTLIAEIDAPNATIDSFGDSVWWAFETVTTVGYGDYTPVTTAGRTTAVIIMFTGAAAVGGLTAVLASWFATRAHGAGKQEQEADDAANAEAATQPSAEQATIEALHTRLAAMEHHLAELIRRLDTSQGGVSVTDEIDGKAAPADTPGMRGGK